MTPALQAAIDGLYEAFSEVRRPHTVGGQLRNLNPAWSDALLAPPLRDVAANSLAAYADDVLTTSGCLDAIRYFLPRMLEIQLVDDDWMPCAEMLASYLRAENFQDMPTLQRAAIWSFFEAAIEAARSNDDPEKLDRWLCAFRRLNKDLPSFLAAIAASPPLLLKWYECNSEHLLKGHLRNGFWNYPLPEEQPLVAWFRSPEIQNAIMAQYGLA